MPDHARTDGGVFLSYAREDADAARRIAEALRGFGIEVWFDQNELRGGDAWDATIRKRIKECALFLPIVSAQTQARAEGYFRREWKLAIDRTHDMAAGRAFIIPVVIDDTAEADAEVPEEFMKLQWTRLAQGEPTPDFVARVKGLLAKPRRPALRPDLPKPPTLPPMLKQAALARKAAAAGAAPAAPERKSGIPAWMWMLIAVVVFMGVAVAIFVLRPKASAPAGVESSALSVERSAAPAKPAERAPSSVALAKDDKSIAVLPFENLSDNKDNAYFADGVHEDLLTDLAQISDLKVIARTSVMEYRGTTKKIQEIARELGVAYVLEGSVRRAGNRVRVVCQLIDGRTGQHVLAPDPYDRDLADIFAIQSELARTIAATLQAALAPSEADRLARAPTKNLAAYDLYLKSKDIYGSVVDWRSKIDQTQPLLESALQYDPKFAQAWAQLGTLHLSAYNRFDQTETRRMAAQRAIDRARELDPDDPAIMALRVNYDIDVRDLDGAASLAAELSRRFPTQAVTYHVLARLSNRQGRPSEALENYRRARDLDPRNAAILDSLASTYIVARHYDEAIAVRRAQVDLEPRNLRSATQLALLPFHATGSEREMEALLQRLPPDPGFSDPSLVAIRASWAGITGDLRGFIRLWEQSGPNWRIADGPENLAIGQALVLDGQAARARPILEKERERFRARVATRPDVADNWFSLAMTFALLGDKAGAAETWKKMEAAIPPQEIRGSRRVLFLAWTGEKDLALDELARCLAGKAGVPPNVHMIRRSIDWRPLQGDPRFEALLNDPKNNAPLF
ncbi:MAG TPA: TIR domain-containing protein [Lacunisphaera sp.]|nr:TIR domain-containing protein [Lacunisphaera sp.]